MSIAEVRSSDQMGRPTINGNAMTPCAVYPLRVTGLLGLVLICAGCSGMLPAGETIAPEPQIQAPVSIRDRGQELAALRGELAAARIAAAKKEAELQELRDLVRQLRLENAESREAFLDLRERAEQRQPEIEKGRDDQDRQVQSQATHRLATLSETVMNLAQEVGRLRQELARQVASESPTSSKTISLKSGEPSAPDVQVHPVQRMPSVQQDSTPSLAISPVALTVTSTSVAAPPSTITVRPGDTLGRLATRTRTSVSRLRAVNQLTSDVLEVGQVLVVPPVSSPSPK